MRLSVIIPGFNTSERWWRRCVESVLVACEGIEAEVICVDDGSKERPTYLEEYGVKVIYLDKNAGQSTARNTALKTAKGEYVTFVDSDDEIRPKTYTECFKCLDKYNTDIAMYGVRGVWVYDGLQRGYAPNEENLSVPSGKQIRKIYGDCLFEYPVNKLYRRRFMEEHGIHFEPQVCPGEDTIFNLQFVKNRATWCSVNYEGYLYYRYDGSSLSRYFPNLRYSVLAKAKAWKEAIECMPEAELLQDLAECNEFAPKRREWLNMWRRGSVATMGERWRYLKANQSVEKLPPSLALVYRSVYTFLRAYAYVRPIRRWHIRHLFHDVENWRGEFS